MWDSLTTSWLALDCELMPWSAKAQELLAQQYAPAGAAGRAALRRTVALLRQATERIDDVAPLVQWYEQRATMVGQYVDAYRHYCWPVHSLLDLKLAPFHLLASEGAVHSDQDHLWHMEQAAKLAAADPQLLIATPHRVVELASDVSEQEATAWWEELTAVGGEGMVVKPLDFIANGSKGPVQPAIKCRGREYLRIIYGPEYTAENNLKRLRFRGLGRKRSLAMREFALGLESLHRFIEREPLRRVHECVFGVLALESEPVDPRL